MLAPIVAPSSTYTIDPFVVVGVACEGVLLVVIDELAVEDLDEEAIVVTDELMLALSVKWY